MSPRRIDQSEFGARDNCQSACLAMLLGLELDQVPNFTLAGEDNACYRAQAEWLAARGWALLTIVPYQALPWPPARGWYIAGGVSPRGHRHSVLFHNGEPWHDPHPDRGGISSVQDIDILMPLRPFECVVAQQEVA